MFCILYAAHDPYQTQRYSRFPTARWVPHQKYDYDQPGSNQSALDNPPEAMLWHMQQRPYLPSQPPMSPQYLIEQSNPSTFSSYPHPDTQPLFSEIFHDIHGLKSKILHAYRTDQSHILALQQEKDLLAAQIDMHLGEKKALLRQIEDLKRLIAQRQTVDPLAHHSTQDRPSSNLTRPLQRASANPIEEGELIHKIEILALQQQQNKLKTEELQLKYDQKEKAFEELLGQFKAVKQGFEQDMQETQRKADTFETKFKETQNALRKNDADRIQSETIKRHELESAQTRLLDQARALAQHKRRIEKQAETITSKDSEISEIQNALEAEREKFKQKQKEFIDIKRLIEKERQEEIAGIKRQNKEQTDQKIAELRKTIKEQKQKEMAHFREQLKINKQKEIAVMQREMEAQKQKEIIEIQRQMEEDQRNANRIILSQAEQIELLKRQLKEAQAKNTRIQPINGLPPQAETGDLDEGRVETTFVTESVSASQEQTEDSTKPQEQEEGLPASQEQTGDGAKTQEQAEGLPASQEQTGDGAKTQEQAEAVSASQEQAEDVSKTGKDYAAILLSNPTASADYSGQLQENPESSLTSTSIPEDDQRSDRMLKMAELTKDFLAAMGVSQDLQHLGKDEPPSTNVLGGIQPLEKYEKPAPTGNDQKTDNRPTVETLFSWLTGGKPVAIIPDSSLTGEQHERLIAALGKKLIDSNCTFVGTTAAKVFQTPPNSAEDCGSMVLPSYASTLDGMVNNVQPSVDAPVGATNETSYTGKARKEKVREREKDHDKRREEVKASESHVPPKGSVERKRLIQETIHNRFGRKHRDVLGLGRRNGRHATKTEEPDLISRDICETDLPLVRQFLATPPENTYVQCVLNDFVFLGDDLFRVSVDQIMGNNQLIFGSIEFKYIQRSEDIILTNI